ncbi:hypothetical protein [Phenylobacterium sp.]|uniref:hypothetical protein n=1 Tax=Phenylobacterium sp. TaxID=1871053 RepID=UPI0025DEE09B|nr:hypothetical protein [Phenylobacterium sp.]MBX3482552.1 hypothetical protein [Phenylobacterium sp.]MCW5758760.1 hypothetical protein [Phenylobacterium sp.]
MVYRLSIRLGIAPKGVAGAAPPSPQYKSWLGNGTAGSHSSYGTAGGITVYGPWGGPNYTRSGGSPGQTTEAAAQTVMRIAGVLADMSHWVSQNFRPNGNVVWRTRVNGADGNQIATMPPGSFNGGQSFTDTTHSDAVAEGDYVGMSITFAPEAGDDHIVSPSASLSLTTTDVQAQQIAAFSIPGITKGNTSNGYFSLGSGPSNTTSGTGYTARGIYNQIAATTASLQVYFSASDYTGGTGTVKSHIWTAAGVAADGNQVVIWPTSGQAPAFREDTTHSDTLAQGDRHSCHHAAAGGSLSSIVVNTASMRFVYDAPGYSQMVTAGQTKAGQGSAVWWPAVGTTDTGVDGTGSTGVENTTILSFGGVWDRLAVSCNANTLAADGHMYGHYRRSGSFTQGNQAVTITAGGGAGTYIDTTHSDTLVAGDGIICRQDADLTSSATVIGLTSRYAAA